MVFAETVPAEQCEVLAAISEGGITSRSFTIMGKPSCGHARDWAQLVKTANCTSTVYNDGTVKLARCEQ